MTADLRANGVSAHHTLVELTWREKRIENRIRFGRIVDEQRLDRRRRIVSFAPSSVFAFVRWAGNEYGTIISRIDIVRTVAAGEPFQTLPFVRPGGEVLLRTDGWPKVERVLQAIDAVLQVLFWPAAADDYSVPRLFWDTPVGRMLTLAKFRAYRPQDLISVDEAVRLLGVTTPTLYRWMEDRALDYVRDDTSNRTWIVRRDVDVLKGFAETFTGRRTTPPQAKAS